MVPWPSCAGSFRFRPWYMHGFQVFGPFFIRPNPLRCFHGRSTFCLMALTLSPGLGKLPETSSIARKATPRCGFVVVKNSGDCRHAADHYSGSQLDDAYPFISRVPQVEQRNSRCDPSRNDYPRIIIGFFDKIDSIGQSKYASYTCTVTCSAFQGQ